MNNSPLHCPLYRTWKNIHPWDRTAQAALSSHLNTPFSFRWRRGFECPQTTLTCHSGRDWQRTSQPQLQNYHGNPVLMTHVSSQRLTVLPPLLYDSLEGLKMLWYHEDQRWHFRTEQGSRHVPTATQGFFRKVTWCIVSDSLYPHGLYSPPGSSVHGILQARILERVAISFSKGSSWPWDQAQVSHTAGRFFTIWATRDR